FRNTLYIFCLIFVYFSLLHFIGVTLNYLAFFNGPTSTPFQFDQFKRPEQNKQLKQLYAILYWVQNAASFLANFCTPYMRFVVKCFGKKFCYSLIFGISGCVYVISQSKLTFWIFKYIINIKNDVLVTY